ncbi:SDR family oxidoreductase [Natronorubrum thiooxidans]|uniref:SDR family oxidoreductase n=1 Tax=Natronorubrum thiooxidans TaxID=308853 RepID=UPI002E25F47E
MDDTVTFCNAVSRIGVQRLLEAHGSNVPVGRTSDQMELGNTVAFLSSPCSEFIDGVAVPIDGGVGSSNLRSANGNAVSV